MAEPVWLERVVLDAIHLDQLREHGGLHGIRDENILESALARARHKWAYDSIHDFRRWRRLTVTGLPQAWSPLRTRDKSRRV